MTVKYRRCKIPHGGNG